MKALTFQAGYQRTGSRGRERMRTDCARAHGFSLRIYFAKPRG
jgi:hypothetical protein